MTGRVVLITGGTSGLGFEAARYLCEGGNDVVITYRREEKGKKAVEKIRKELPNALIACMELDLSSTISIKDFVKEFTKTKKKLSVLINNAGMAPHPNSRTAQKTTDGLEYVMATNYFGHFLLTNLLLDYIIQTGNILGDSRIINVTCRLHDHENNWTTRNLDFLDPGNLQLSKSGTYKGLQAYKNSKLCLVLMAYHLAEKLRGTNVICNAVDPGWAPTTKLSRHAGSARRLFGSCCVHRTMRPCVKMTKSPKKAAILICDVADSVKYAEKTGKYFVEGVEDRSSIESYDRDLQKSVWKKTSDLLGVNRFADEGFDDVSLTSRDKL